MYIPRGVVLVEIPQRKGKENGQKGAVRQARGDIIVFNDTAIRLDREALSRIISDFFDPFVGCVSSEDQLIARNGRPCAGQYF